MTFPSRSNHDRIRTDDLRRLIAYLAGIPRLHIHHMRSLSFVCVCVCVCVCVAMYLKRRGSLVSKRSEHLEQAGEALQGNT